MTSSAHAVTVNLSFTAVLSDSTPVHGEFTYEAASLSDPVNSLTSVNLTFDGHTYSLAEVDHQYPFSSYYNTVDNIFASIWGLGVTNGFNDFLLSFYPSTQTPFSLQISSTGAHSSFVYYTNNFTEFSLTTGSSATPLPPSFLLLTTGLGMMGLLGWRKSRKRSLALAMAH